MVTRARSDTARNVVILVAALNLACFGVEFAVALAIGSVSLFADSIDFLEDASVNFLIAVALGWRATWRARVGMILAGVLLVPALGALGALWAADQARLAGPSLTRSSDGNRGPCTGDQPILCIHAGACSAPLR